MAKRGPEGKIKDECRKIAREHGLIFWQVEGKACNGFPDTQASKTTGGGILIEFKQPGKEPEPQQYLRIWELRNAGIEAWWCDSVESYMRLVRLLPHGYTVFYPDRIKRIIRKQYGFDAI